MDAQTCKRQIDNILKEDRNASIKNEDIIVCGKKIGSLGDQNMQEKVIFYSPDKSFHQRLNHLSPRLSLSTRTRFFFNALWRR